jgi:hypothetical protein
MDGPRVFCRGRGKIVKQVVSGWTQVHESHRSNNLMAGDLHRNKRPYVSDEIPNVRL